jgi:hypothetical protein
MKKSGRKFDQNQTNKKSLQKSQSPYIPKEHKKMQLKKDIFEEVILGNFEIVSTLIERNPNLLNSTNRLVYFEILANLSSMLLVNPGMFSLWRSFFAKE